MPDTASPSGVTIVETTLFSGFVTVKRYLVSVNSDHVAMSIIGGEHVASRLRLSATGSRRSTTTPIVHSAAIAKRCRSGSCSGGGRRGGNWNLIIAPGQPMFDVSCNLNLKIVWY